MSLDGSTAAGAVQTSPLGSATPGGMSTILEILRLINDIVHSPLAMNIGARFQGQGLNNAPVSNIRPSPPEQGKPAETPGRTDPGLISSNYFDEKTLLAILSTPDGREKFARGIESIIATIGDVKLSEIVKMLREGDLKPAAAEKK